MAAIVTSTLNYQTGALPSFASAAASDTFDNPGSSGKIFVVYRNTNAATRNITITMPGTPLESYGSAKPNPATGGFYTLGATTGELWIPLHPEFADATGRITITTSAQTNVTVAAVRIA